MIPNKIFDTSEQLHHRQVCPCRDSQECPKILPETTPYHHTSKAISYFCLA
jgi:hypothetical protein